MWRVVESWFVKIANKLQKEKGIVYNYVYLLYIYHIVIIISILVIRFAIKFHIFIICPNLWWYSKKYLNIFHIKESNIYIYIHTSNKGPWSQLYTGHRFYPFHLCSMRSTVERQAPTLLRDPIRRSDMKIPWEGILNACTDILTCWHVYEKIGLPK